MKKYLILLIIFTTGIVLITILSHVKINRPLAETLCLASAMLIGIPLIIGFKFLERDWWLK